MAPISKCKQRLIFMTIVITYMLHYLYIYFYYVKYALSESKRTKLNIIIIFGFTMTLITYLLSIFVTPSQSNVSKYFDASNDINYIDQSKPGKEIKSINPNEWTYCEICLQPKFMRSSHCRVCNKCILFRDHHCPWIANCVGYDNFQYFTNFVFWASLSIFLILLYFVVFVFNFSEIHKKYKFSFICLVNLIILNIFNFFMFIGIFGIFFRLIITGYNNKTFLEDKKNYNIETYYPFCNKDNSTKIYNEYNIGFLNHYYYLIGPTLLHLFFPLPKFQNFILKEDSPIFRKCKQPSNLELVKYLRTVDDRYKNALNSKENEPDYFIQLCHKYYDDKEIV